jgi:hypothetical protein
MLPSDAFTLDAGGVYHPVLRGSAAEHLWRDGRVAEGAPLLREYGVKSSIEGSNPSLSASQLDAEARQNHLARHASGGASWPGAGSPEPSPFVGERLPPGKISQLAASQLGSRP